MVVANLGNVVQHGYVGKGNLIERLLGQMTLIPDKSEKYLAAHISTDLSKLVPLMGNTKKYNNLVAGAGFEPATFGL